MDTIFLTVLLTTVITRLQAIHNLVDKIDGVDDIYDEIALKLNNAIAELTKALAIIKALPLAK